MTENESTRHWGVGYNFVVVADSVVVQRDMPLHTCPVPQQRDTAVLRRGQDLVVAQFIVIPEDTVDSVWVKVASDQYTQGWLRQGELTAAVVPDEPLSQGIRLWGLHHVPVAVLLCFAAIAVWLLMRLRGRRCPMVFVDDIPSPWPAALCVVVGVAAATYAVVQRVAPQLWQEFYYHPTLNPFGQPAPIATLLVMWWCALVVCGAALIDIRRCLTPALACVYCVSWAAVVAVLGGLGNLGN